VSEKNEPVLNICYDWKLTVVNENTCMFHAQFCHERKLLAKITGGKNFTSVFTYNNRWQTFCWGLRVHPKSSEDTVLLAGRQAVPNLE